MSEVKIENNGINYSLDFLTSLNAILPDGKFKVKALELANNNDIKLGSLLNELTDEKIDAIEIVKCFEEGNVALHNLFVKAKRLAQYKQLWDSYMLQIEDELTRT